MSEEYLSILNALMNDITEEHQVSVEAVVATGFDFIWHSRTELPNATVAIRATTGFRRSIFELDAMSRLYLSRFDWEEVSYKFFPGGFFTSGVDMRTLKPEEARELIKTTPNLNGRKRDLEILEAALATHQANSQ